MAKRLLDGLGQEVVICKVPKVVDVEPLGSQILVEILQPQEALNSNLQFAEGVQIGAPQAYVLKTGPSLVKELGIKKGDRVLLQGSYVPLPKLTGEEKRDRALVEPHTIKALLVEEKTPNFEA